MAAIGTYDLSGLADEAVSAEVTPQAQTPVSEGTPPAPAAQEPAPGPVDYTRFSEVLQERNALREQQEQWGSVLGAAQTLGLTPQEVLQRAISQQQAAPEIPATIDPEQQFHDALRERGVDPLTVSDEVYALHRALWDQQQQFETFQASFRELQHQGQQAEVERIRGDLSAQLAQLATTYPVLENPALGNGLKRALLANYGIAREMGIDATLDGVARELLGGFEDYNRTILGTYAAQKQSDLAATPPVAIGGGTPAPFDRKPLGEMTPEERERRVMSALASAVPEGI